MLAADAKNVIGLDVLAFKTYYKNKTARAEREILSCLALNPSGCFVAEDKKIIGYVFSRRWGRLGWIGTFGVHPKHHSKGIGKALFAKAYAKLDKECDIIGLETMPEAPYNIGLYLKLGFKLIPPSLILAKSGLVPSQKTPALTEASPEKISGISRKLLRGIDYGREAENALEFGWGKAFSIGKTGFCILSVRNSGKKNFLLVNVMGLPASRKENVLSSLRSLENYALSKKADRIVIPINSIYQNAVKSLLTDGYKVRRCSVRMTKKGDYGNFPAIDISRWAM
ncbi:MAG: hypothetical protein A2X28_08685 [Elusimicrobia bacterium GWA2_56_46]|nr:MAG: hypothetical protein A2X28_08685 [Elusimicrobia bacterium GWA2_56_46]OGR55211.1 MAG: hypothetical protein A2X39_01590 [Elusimicrobia bacterium GWC2_56_31]